MQIIPGQTGIEFASELSTAMNIPVLIPEFKFFNDGEQYLRLPKPPDKEVLIIQSLYSPQDTNLFQLVNLISTLKYLGTEKIIAFIPYMCYARADKDVLGGEAISSRTVLHLLESSGLNHLITLDIHNPEIFGFAHKMKTTNLFPIKSMANYLRKHVNNVSELQIIAPDNGSINRTTKLAEELNVPSTHLSKVRDPVTKEVNVQIGKANVVCKRIVLFDDIMSTGTSLIQSASLLSLFDVEEIHVLITHALGTNAVDRLREIGGGIVASTKSVPNIISKISILDDLLDVLID